MDHLLEISELTQYEIIGLIQRALYFKQEKDYPRYPQHTVANLFYENSTRTRVSFEIAANNLSMPVINLDLQSSSESKGEVIEDTFLTLGAMGISLFVIRHAQEHIQQWLASKCSADMHIINAGDGKHAHPSQALLDMMTIIENKPHLEQLKIAIVGNIKHSRVANSLQSICSLLGVGELTLIAPPIWQPDSVQYGRIADNLENGIKDADVVICLRVQHERLLVDEELELTNYHQDYGLTQKTLAYAKADAMVMHPGPMNRGVEIDSDVADGEQSFILQQVENGVFMRMAILEALIQDGALT